MGGAEIQVMPLREEGVGYLKTHRRGRKPRGKRQRLELSGIQSHQEEGEANFS